MTNPPCCRWRQRQSAAVLAALLALALQAVAALPAEPAAPASAQASLPRSYRLDGVVLRLLRQPAQGQPRQALVLAGAGGSATLAFGRPASSLSYALPAADLVGLINGLYRLRFFDLPAQLGARTAVFLLPDGTLGTQVAGLSDTTAMTVCFTLPGYEKCVRYTEGDGPQELEAWARAALADALRRAPPAAPGK